MSDKKLSEGQSTVNCGWGINQVREGGTMEREKIRMEDLRGRKKE